MTEPEPCADAVRRCGALFINLGRTCERDEGHDGLHWSGMVEWDHDWRENEQKRFLQALAKHPMPPPDYIDQALESTTQIDGSGGADG